ncbi:hypothetical protein ES703_15061 [subsurface metagenome]
MSAKNTITWKDLDERDRQLRKDISEILDLKLKPITQALDNVYARSKKALGLGESNEDRIEDLEKKLAVKKARNNAKTEEKKLGFQYWQVWLMFIGTLLMAISAILVALLT